jgi:hypothetical protein
MDVTMSFFLNMYLFVLSCKRLSAAAAITAKKRPPKNKFLAAEKKTGRAARKSETGFGPRVFRTRAGFFTRLRLAFGDHRFFSL